MSSPCPSSLTPAQTALFPVPSVPLRPLRVCNTLLQASWGQKAWVLFQSAVPRLAPHVPGNNRLRIQMCPLDVTAPARSSRRGVLSGKRGAVLSCPRAVVRTWGEGYKTGRPHYPGL